MKDFHDLWSIAGQHVFEATVLQRAVIQTFSRRNTDLPHQTPTAFTPDFIQDPTQQQVWAAFLRRAGLATVGLEEVVRSLRAFLEPVLSGAATGRWNPQLWIWEPRGVP